MPRNINIFTLSFLLIYLLPFTLFTQEWSEPVNISNMEGLDNTPDLCIDKNGAVHCVWFNKIGTNFSKIYYSKSIDDGTSWTTPEDISQNDEKWLGSPHILSDTDNNLHLTYDYDIGSPAGKAIHYKMFDGINWNQVDTVSEGIPGAMHNRSVIDNNNRFYCFWYNDLNNGTTYYRYLEPTDTVWSEIFIPYDNMDFVFIYKALADYNNNLHCTGYYKSFDQIDNLQRIIYVSYSNGVWSNITEISNDYDAWTGNDIGLDFNSLPHITWRQATSETIPPNDGTLYSLFNGADWTIPELIIEDPSSQNIIIDENNYVNLFDVEKTENGSMMVHYYKNNNNWEGQIIDESDWNTVSLSFANYNNKIYVVYLKPTDNGNGEIFFKKTDIITSTQRNQSQPKLSGFKIYPNPFRNKTSIGFKLNRAENILVKVYNLKGELIKILLDTNKQTGSYKITWDGTDTNGSRIKSGIYLIRLKAGKNVITRSVEFVK